MTAFTTTNIRIFALMLILSLQSCQFFDTKTSKDKMLQKELKSINWKQVDEFPMISACEKLNDEAQQKQCFFESLSADIKLRIRKNCQEKLILNDTIFVKVSVLANSKVLFETQKLDKNRVLSHEKIDSILKIDTLDFPKIKPALKRGMPVKSEFVLPIVFN